MDYNWQTFTCFCAECKARLNDLEGAGEDLLTLRKNRMPEADAAIPSATAADQAALVSFIIEERIRNLPWKVIAGSICADCLPTHCLPAPAIPIPCIITTVQLLYTYLNPTGLRLCYPDILLTPIPT